MSFNKIILIIKKNREKNHLTLMVSFRGKYIIRTYPSIQSLFAKTKNKPYININILYND